MSILPRHTENVFAVVFRCREYRLVPLNVVAGQSKACWRPSLLFKQAIPLSTASKQYRVPRSTLRWHFHNRNVKAPGQTALGRVSSAWK